LLLVNGLFFLQLRGFECYGVFHKPSERQGRSEEEEEESTEKEEDDEK